MLVDRLTALGLSVTSSTIAGDDPAEAVTALAQSLPAAFVAMATHGRTGLSRVTLGSIAAATARRATCPVLVVRPPGLARAG